MVHRVNIFVFDGMTLLDASGPADVFHHADPENEHYSVQYISPDGGTVTTSSGLALANTIAAAQAEPADTVLVSGGTALVRPDPSPHLLAAVETVTVSANRVASVCTGAFLLAALGLLDGRRATTHWRHSSYLARWYPRITVEPDVIHIRDGPYLTSAGVTAGIDLALAIVEQDLGVATARDVARELVMFMQRPGGQSQYSSALSTPPVADDQLRTLIEQVSSNPAGEYSVGLMAEKLAISPRHLNRLFRSQIGTTPSQWLEQLRVDVAKALLLEGHTVSTVARKAGFGTDETLRAAFTRQLGTTPSAFRARFKTTGTQ